MSYIPRLTIKSTARTTDFMSSLPNYLGKVIHYLKIQKNAPHLFSERNGLKVLTCSISKIKQSLAKLIPGKMYSDPPGLSLSSVNLFCGYKGDVTREDL